MTCLAPACGNTTASQPLYAIEEHLAILVDTAELVPPDQEQEFLAEFQLALSTAVDKRDRVGQFMAHLEQQITFANFEINRLRERKALYQQALERIEEYVTCTIEALGMDSKGKFRKLEGKTVTFSLTRCPPSVDLIDEAAIPADYKTLTLKMPALIWEKILADLEPGRREAISGHVRCEDVSIEKRAIRSAITAGVTVPGADLAIGKTSLRRL